MAASSEPFDMGSLVAAVRVQEVIAQAVGIVMAREDVGAATAREHLARTAERNGTPVAVVAQVLVATGFLL